jgi:hypothetical protein
MNTNWEARRQRRDERRAAGFGPHPMGGMVFGLAMIAGGVLFLLRNAGLVDFRSIWQFWPLFPLFMGLTRLIQPRGRHDMTSGAFLTAVGGFWLLWTLRIFRSDVWNWIWPFVLIALGVMMLLRRQMPWSTWTPGASGAADSWPASPTDSNADTIFSESFFGGAKRRITSQAFQGGHVSVLFGGAEIDLRNAGMAKPTVALHLEATFGGVVVSVPPHWNVDLQVSGIFGGSEDQTLHPVNDPANVAPTLFVTGTAVFGGVTVRN